MSLRFRKSIRLAPGIRWNLSGSGSSFTLGPRGASLNVGPAGSFLNAGIAGTGLYSRQRISESSPSSEKQPRPSGTVSMTCGVDDNGILSFHDAAGNEVAVHVVETAKKQNKAAITSLIQRKCDEINAQIEALGKLHHSTPYANVKPRFSPPLFGNERPVKPSLRVAGFFEKFFKNRMRKIDEENSLNETRHLSALNDWEAEKRTFDDDVTRQRTLVEDLIYHDMDSMATFLELRLKGIDWPRETSVDFDIADNGLAVRLNVDLPEVEMMPTKSAAMPARGLRLSVKELPPTKIQRLYMEHIHCVAFRLIGETFAALPQAQMIVFSGYSQRRDSATGQLQNEYLLSVRVQRKEWLKIHFDHLMDIDVVESLNRHELRREITRLNFKKIEPFDF
jgi:Protein of unknown function (DUF4236)